MKNTLWVLSFLFFQFGTTSSQIPSQVIVAWDDSTTGQGWVRAMSNEAPFSWMTAPIATGPQSVLHQWKDELFVVSPVEDRIVRIDLRTWAVRQTFSLPKGSEARDIVVLDSQRAYLSCASQSHLLRLNLVTGSITEAVDLSMFASCPDMNRMILYGNRLFVQLRQLDSEARNNFAGGGSSDAALAVIDLEREELVDVDPTTPEIDPILLVGTAPRFRMQIVRDPSPQLFVSATGETFDSGGIEVVDLLGLHSLGIVIAENSGNVGADLGAFVVVSPKLGYLTFTTDLLLSSHLMEFKLSGYVIPEQLHLSLNYFVPALAHDPKSATLYIPTPIGIDVMDVNSNQTLTPTPTPTSGPVTDVLVVQ